MKKETTARAIIGLALAMLVPACKPDSEPTPTEYLDCALNHIQVTSLYSSQVDWPSVNARCRQMCTNPETTSDTYPAICHALSQLKDSHGWLKGLDGKLLCGKDVETKSQLDRKTSASLHKTGLLRVRESSIGYLNTQDRKIDLNIGNEIGNELHRSLTEMAGKADCWIIDLRSDSRNGRYMWPMFLALEPLLGGETMGAHRVRMYSDLPHQGMDVLQRWYHKQGEVGAIYRGKKQWILRVPDAAPNIDDPVAVLINADAAKAAESVALALKGRPRTRFFGERTAGDTFCIQETPLGDGATLCLTNGRLADRNDNEYPNGVEPDQKCSTHVNGNKDPALDAAIKWLASQAHQKKQFNLKMQRKPVTP